MLVSSHTICLFGHTYIHRKILIEVCLTLCNKHMQLTLFTNYSNSLDYEI